MRMILFDNGPQFDTEEEAVSAVLSNVPRWFGLRPDQFTRLRYHPFSEPGSGIVVGHRQNGSGREVHVRNNRVIYFTVQGVA